MCTWVDIALPFNGTASDKVSLANEIQDVFRDGFSIKDEEAAWSLRGILKRLDESNLLRILLCDSNEVIGYGFYSLSIIKDEEHILWEDSVCLRKTMQGRDYGSKVLTGAISYYSDKKIYWLGGRTQNPIVIQRYSCDSEIIYPFDRDYETEDGSRLLNLLLLNIHELTSVRNLDYKHGICIAAYREGRLGDYTIDMKDPEIAAYEHKLAKWGFDRNRGDAIIVVGRCIDYS